MTMRSHFVRTMTGMLGVWLLSLAGSLPMSYAQPTPISGIINDYTAVVDIDMTSAGSQVSCAMLTVDDPSSLRAGDRVLVIQMQGATISLKNDATFGTVTSPGNAGNYEFNRIGSVSGNVVTLVSSLSRSYDVAGRVQMIRVPEYEDATVVGTLTCLPWDGRIGGVLAFEVRDSLTMDADIDVTGRGFRGGLTFEGMRSCSPSQDYFYSDRTDQGANKGEGIALYDAAHSRGRGAPANAGGGGNNHNAGGGGGANYGAGGMGGSEWSGCSQNQEPTRGRPGWGLPYATTTNQIYMGGGGGAGHTNNGTGTDGGNGGGIVIVTAARLVANGRFVSSMGADVPVTIGQGQDGCGGGGAGGAVLLKIGRYVGGVNVRVGGGNGGNTTFTERVGPGGGGGGGVLWVPESTLPTAIALAADGGRNGVHVKASDDPWGATAGENGGSLTGLVLPEGTVRALPLIEALGSSTLCQGDSVILRIVDADTVQWSTGATTTAITVSEPGVYWARAVTGGGCTGTDTIVVQRNPAVLAYAGSDVRVCQGGSIVLDGGGVSGTPPYSYEWTPSVGLDASDVPHPVATPDVPTRYLLTVTDARGCRDTASVFVEPVSADLQIAWTGSAGEWRFDSVDLATPRCDSLRIANTGTDTIVIGSAALRHNTTFSIPPSQLPLRVPPGQDRPLFVCCDPESIGEYNDTLLLRANCDLLVRLAASGNYPAIFGFDECGSRIGLRAPDSDNVLVKISSPYPNPASEVVTVPFERSSRPGASAPAERFVMRDLLGTVVAEGEYHRSSVRNLAGRIDERGSCTFDVAGMPQGYYFITVSTATETFLFPVVVDRR